MRLGDAHFEQHTLGCVYLARHHGDIRNVIGYIALPFDCGKTGLRRGQDRVGTGGYIRDANLSTPLARLDDQRNVCTDRHVRKRESAVGGGNRAHHRTAGGCNSARHSRGKGGHAVAWSRSSVRDVDQHVRQRRGAIRGVDRSADGRRTAAPASRLLQTQPRTTGRTSLRECLCTKAKQQR